MYTIGHSTHPLEYFIGLLSRHGITALCDVRSKPYSRINPRFNRESLKKSLEESRISYLFLGRELGARSEDPHCYQGGKVQYDRLGPGPNCFSKGSGAFGTASARGSRSRSCARRKNHWSAIA